MPSSSLSPSSSQTPQYLQELLESARPFLRGELESIDTNLPSLLAVLRSVGAGECWHKHGSFLDHLLDIYRILKLWKAPDSVSLCGLFHSAYSNSCVNLAIFEPPHPNRTTIRVGSSDNADALVQMLARRFVNVRNVFIDERLSISLPVYPSPQISTSVVEPYNSVLTTHSLLEHTFSFIYLFYFFILFIPYPPVHVPHSHSPFSKSLSFPSHQLSF
ncbi:hypothetical protein CsSME_00046991 [Camellia sinensis var. sinensis]